MRHNTLVIVHGESERILVGALGHKLRSNIPVYPISFSEKTVDLPNVGNLLHNGPFKSERALHSAYPMFDYRRSCRCKMPNLRIFPLLDIDQHGQLKKSYLSRDMFRDSPFHDRIVPIFNDRSLDDVMDALGMSVDRCNKTRSYTKAFTDFDPLRMYEEVKKCENTNMEKLLLWCLASCPEYQGLFRTECEWVFGSAV